MNRRSLQLFVLILVVFQSPARADEVKYSGRVLGVDGKPAVGISVGSRWYVDTKKKMIGHDTVKTDAEGRFEIKVASFRRPISLMAVSADNKLGGRIVADPKSQTEGFEIKLGPLVRVHGGFQCSKPDHPVTMSDVLAFALKDEKTPREVKNFILVEESQSFDDDDDETLKPDQKPLPPTFDLWLTPGKYIFNFFEPMMPEEHAGKAQDVTVKADQPGLDLDLGLVELKPSHLAEGYGKPAPPLQIKAARGLPTDVKLTDFKGKWVILEFWSWGCGPCISMGLPSMVDFYEEHAVDRDKFVILALHNDSAADFAELDRKIASTIKNLWRGKPLPFPILIDDDGKTYESYGISAIPSTVLINPEGKLVRPDLEELEAVLTPIPMARQIARGLDHQVEMGTSPTGVDLKFLLDTLSGMSRILIEPDPTAGIDLKAEVPLTMAGRLSLRSWLELALEPMGLVAVSGETGLIVKKAGPGYRRDSTPSDTQREAASRITTKLESKTRFAFDKKTLAEVAQHFETEIEENFVIDPSDRLAGRLDFKTEVSGKAEDLPLKDALKSLLEPMGIEAVIVDEVVILRRRRP